jgi:hypothetical protein
VTEVKPDRGRDTSPELTEVRTVLSRAEDARLTLWHYQTGQLKHGGRWVPGFNDDLPRLVDPDPPDPEIAEMIEALDQAITLLDRWRRTGRARRKPRCALHTTLPAPVVGCPCVTCTLERDRSAGQG